MADLIENLSQACKEAAMKDAQLKWLQMTQKEHWKGKEQ